MNIVIIGSGNVAAVLGRKLIAAGHTIVQIISRNASAASELAYEWDTESANYLTLINKNADLYIIAVSDNAIAEIVQDLSLQGKVVAHTAAAVPMDVLKKVSAHYGVLYPLQSLRKEMKRLPDIPFYVAGNDDIARTQLQVLADAISFQPPPKRPAMNSD
jgi:predicted dinucleotide-binding enzyme